MQTAKNRGQPADLAAIACPLERMKVAIIRLRKGIDTAASWQQLRADVDGADLSQLNSRWLVSVLDTFADFGTPQEQRAALLVVLMVTFDRFQAAIDGMRQTGPLWDGLTVMGTNPRADAHRNLFRRIGRVMRDTPAIDPLFRAVIVRGLESPRHVLNRLNKVSKRDVVADVRRVMQDQPAHPAVPAQVVTPKAGDTEIPRMIHFIWLGEPMPEWADRFMRRARKLMPTWDVRVCTEVPADLPDDLRAAVERCGLQCQRADIIRAWLLWVHGGIYLDCDVLLVRSLDELTSLAPFALRGPGGVFNAVMGSPSKSPQIGAILDYIRRHHARFGKPNRRTAYGPDALRAARPAMQRLPPHYFTPLGNSKNILEQAQFTVLDYDAQVQQLELHRGPDGTAPFGQHIFGLAVPGKGRSSFVRAASVAPRPRHDRHGTGIVGSDEGAAVPAIDAVAELKG